MNFPNNPAILTQPGSNRLAYQHGSVTVRNLQATDEDTSFAGRLLVEAFRDKFEHATSKNSIEKCYRAFAKEHQGRAQLFYDRTFVAEYEGKRAGILALKFHGDPTPSFRTGSSNFSEFGCCDGIGLWCLSTNLDTESVNQNKCCLDHICVEEQYRGRGIGKALMIVADQEARRLNCKEIYLWVATTNRAQHLYERQGYIEVEKSGTCLCCYTWCATGEKEFARMVKQL